MKQEVKEILANAMDVDIDYFTEDNAGDIYEFLSCEVTVQSEVTLENRWWNDTEIVVQVGDFFIAYGDATTTGDRTPCEVGYER